MVKFTHVAVDMMQIKFGKQPTADFKHGWILGAAAAKELQRGVPWDDSNSEKWQDKEWVTKNYEKAAVETKATILWAIGMWYDTVLAWDFCIPKDDPAMVQLADNLATLDGGPNDPGYTADPELFGQTTHSKQDNEECHAHGEKYD